MNLNRLNCFLKKVQIFKIFNILRTRGTKILCFLLNKNVQRSSPSIISSFLNFINQRFTLLFTYSAPTKLKIKGIDDFLVFFKTFFL
jgi:hypothetical protein